LPLHGGVLVLKQKLESKGKYSLVTYKIAQGLILHPFRGNKVGDFFVRKWYVALIFSFIVRFKF